MDDATLSNVAGQLPVPEGETALTPDPAVDAFDAAELAPHSMDAELVPAPPSSDIMPDVDTQHTLDPANQSEETVPEDPQPQVQTPVQP